MGINSEWQFEVLTVSEITSSIKQFISGRFRNVCIEGEVSNAKLYPSGHLYFTLKDDMAMMKAVAFNYRARFAEGAMINDGDLIVCEGRIDVYEKRGEYQLIVSNIIAQGNQGVLYARFLALKEKLFREGLFDEGRKRPLPFLPDTIGIVTSPAGAAVRDMLKVIYNKFPNMGVLIYPVKVQGDEAASEIVEGIEYLNAAGEVDVIITGRGGGSPEDLAPFNDERVARAVHASKIPVVSAVGHEIDFTIADFVADARAPTPTAAADMVVQDKRELLNVIEGMHDLLLQRIAERLERSRSLLYQGMMELRERRDFFISSRMYLDELSNNLIHGFPNYFRDRKVAVESLAQRLHDLNPEGILRRGYSITTKSDTGDVVYSPDEVIPGEELNIRLHKGEIGVAVKEKRS
jgi:exodeoxyribonuclease VII large subunit